MTPLQLATGTVVSDKKNEYAQHMVLKPNSPNGPLEIQCLRYAQLKKLDSTFIELFERELDKSSHTKTMLGACYQLSELIRFSKQLADQPASSKPRDDFIRIQTYLLAIAGWDGSDQSLAKTFLAWMKR